MAEEPKPIPIKELSSARVLTMDTFHYPGGLRGRRVGGGWCIGPVRRDGQLEFIAPPQRDPSTLSASVRMHPIGHEEIIDPNSILPTRIWSPLLADGLKNQPADIWAMIAYSAQKAGDLENAKLARKLSASLRAAGLQLRNISDEYEKQLIAALRSGAIAGQRFTNIPLMDMHLACHAALAEMASVRDYLAQIAARRVGAPADVDALNRLWTWSKKAVNSEASKDQLVGRLLSASEPSGTDNWLSTITDYRNLFLHKEPMATNEHARLLVLEARGTPAGGLEMVILAIETKQGSGKTVDALDRFAGLFASLCDMAMFASGLAPHPPATPHFISE